MSSKTTPLQLSIPEPCSEDWNKMTSVDDRHRHCDSCAKNIVDFSSMTDGQISRYYKAQGGKICGRFRADQLDRPLHAYAQPASWWGRAATWTGLLFAGGSLQAQPTLDTVFVNNYTVPVADPVCNTLAEKENDRITSVEARSEIEQDITASQPKLTYTGQITEEETGEPLIGASIIIKGTHTGTVTDIDGNFRVDAEPGQQLICSYTGFRSREIKLTNSTEVLVVALNYSQALMGDIVIVQYRRNTLFNELKQFIRRHRYYAEERKAQRLERRAARRKAKATAVFRDTATPDKTDSKDLLTNTAISPEQPLPLKDDQLTIYPNPATGPLTVVYDSKKPQTIMLEVLTATGEPVYFMPFDVVAGKNEMRITPQKAYAAPGAYVMRIVDENGVISIGKFIHQ